VTAAVRTDLPAAPAALSSDELRALARVAGAVLPPELLGGWHRDDSPVADTVAVRSLLARGMLQLRPGGGGVALTGAARGALDPLLDARALAGLSLLTRDGQERRRLVAESAAGTLLLTEREPDVWTLDPIPGPTERAAAWLAADLLDEGPRLAPDGHRIVAPAEALRLADRLLAEGHESAIAAALARAGLPEPAAGTWAAVLRRRVATGEVRLTRRVADGVFAGGAVRWVDAGTAGVWLVEPADAPEDDPDDDPEEAPVLLSDAGVPGVRAALAALLEGGLP
jgi:hypothetical protein